MWLGLLVAGKVVVGKSAIAKVDAMKFSKFPQGAGFQ